MNKIQPLSNIETLLQQALFFCQSGQFTEAKSIYKELLESNSNHPKALTNLGSIELQSGNFEEGVKLIQKSIEVDPNQPYAFYNVGNVLFKLKRYDEALINCDRAIALKPDFAEAYNNRGLTCNELKRLDDALICYDHAIALKPDYAEAYNNRGLTCNELKRLDDALICYERAIALKPGYAEAYSNRGLTFDDLKRYDDALINYDRAIALKPDYAEAYWNKSALKILLGDYNEGWKLYEWRWKYSEQEKFFRNFKQPLWLGEQSISDKTLLIHAEQGLGDAIQFCRYAPMVEAMGAKIVLEVPKALTSLISTLKGNFTIVEKGSPLPYFDLQCPMMSLPLAFKTTVETIPAEIAYLYADEEKKKLWHKKLGSKTKPRIGLAWSGLTIHKNDHNRSISLKQLEPILQLPFEFHSLQKDIRAEDAETLTHFNQIHLHQDELIDFSDTAALVNEIDVIISVDTSVAHLAGALGKTVWILLPFAPDYRWMLDRNDSPWYPNATLFRQPKIDDWDTVISAVTNQLRQYK